MADSEEAAADATGMTTAEDAVNTSSWADEMVNLCHVMSLCSEGCCPVGRGDWSTLHIRVAGAGS